MKKDVIVVVSVVVLLLLSSGVAFAYWQQGKPAAPAPADVATTTSIVTPSHPIKPVVPIAPTPTAHAYGTVTLSLGQSAKFPDVTITPISITQDSRCPVDVQCIQAGTVSVSLRITSSSGNTTQTINLTQPYTFPAGTITLTRVTPDKNSKNTITAASYRLTFDVEKKAVVGQCYVGGCSGEVCSDQHDAVSSCIYRSQFACYKSATCERQTSGACGWTQTPALTSCLAQPDSYTL